MRIQPHDADEINEKLKFDGIYVIENFVDDVELIKLTDDYNKLFSQDIKGTKKGHHPPGAMVRIRVDKCDANEFPQISAIFCSEVFATIARRYLPKDSIINNDIVASHATKNGPISDVHFDTIRALKFMVYLMDTNEANGAFSYAKGPHKDNAAFRKKFLRFGNSLQNLPNIITNEDEVDLQPVCGPAGMLVIFDTDGFHRGGTLKESKERKVIRSRNIFANQNALRPKKYSSQWLWEHRYNPMRFFAPKAPIGRLPSGGIARAK